MIVRVQKVYTSNGFLKSRISSPYLAHEKGTTLGPRSYAVTVVAATRYPDLRFQTYLMQETVPFGHFFCCYMFPMQILLMSCIYFLILQRLSRRIGSFKTGLPNGSPCLCGSLLGCWVGGEPMKPLWHLREEYGMKPDALPFLVWKLWVSVH